MAAGSDHPPRVPCDHLSLSGCSELHPVFPARTGGPIPPETLTGLGIGVEIGTLVITYPSHPLGERIDLNRRGTRFLRWKVLLRM